MGILALCDPGLSAVLLRLGPGHELPNILPSRNRGARSMSAIKPLLDRILALCHKHPTYRRIARTYVCVNAFMCSQCSRGTSHPDGSKRVAFARKIDPSESHPSIFFPSASFNFAREAPPKFIRIRWISLSEFANSRGCFLSGLAFLRLRKDSSFGKSDNHGFQWP